MESEYIAMSTASKLLTIFKALRKKCAHLKGIPIMYTDSKSAISAAKSEYSKSLAHCVRLEEHKIRDEVGKGEIELKWIGTDEQIADALTKPLSRSKFIKFREALLKN